MSPAFSLASFLLDDADKITVNQQPIWIMSDLGKESYTPRGNRIRET